MSTFHRAGTTIIQLATARSASAVHVLRISGREASAFLLRHCRLGGSLTARKAHYCTFFSNPVATYAHRRWVLKSASEGDNPLDKLLALYFPSPHSFTGEDVVELHCHGSLYIVDAIMGLAIDEGLLPAKAGEFSRRAFLNGKLNALQAEAMNALIHATHERTASSALQMLEGRSGLKFSHLQQKTLSMLATLESAIEFPEEDIPEIQFEKEKAYALYRRQLNAMRAHLSAVIENTKRGMALEAGINVVLLGSVNVGKSTLLNALLGERRAIVSNMAGSTRDTLREPLQLQGGKIFISDTAGLRKGFYTSHSLEKPMLAVGNNPEDKPVNSLKNSLKDNAKEKLRSHKNNKDNEDKISASVGSGHAARVNEVEREGIARTLLQVEKADLVLCVVSSEQDWNLVCEYFFADNAIFNDVSSHEAFNGNAGRKKRWRFVVNKTDLLGKKAEKLALRMASDMQQEKRFSAIDESKWQNKWIAQTSFVEDGEKTRWQASKRKILAMLEEFLSEAIGFNEESGALQSARQLRVCEEILNGFHAIDEMLKLHAGEEEVLDELYCLRDRFGELNVSIGDEQVFNAIFSQFCIGK